MNDESRKLRVLKKRVHHHRTENEEPAELLSIDTNERFSERHFGAILGALVAAYGLIFAVYEFRETRSEFRESMAVQSEGVYLQSRAIKSQSEQFLALEVRNQRQRYTDLVDILWSKIGAEPAYSTQIRTQAAKELRTTDWLIGGDVRNDLRGALLQGTDLRRIDLEGANLSSADLSSANLMGANLYRTFLVQADLNGAILVRANLEEAEIVGANLKEAKLIAATVSMAVLRGANLSGAEFDLLSDMTQYQVDSAICDELTILPFGVVCKSLDGNSP